LVIVTHRVMFHKNSHKNRPSLNIKRKLNLQLLVTVFVFLYIHLKEVSANSEFYYDKMQLENEFKNLETAFELNLQDIKTSTFKNDSSEFTFYDIEMESFCMGFCCFPVGINKYTQKNTPAVERKSFWAGCGTLAATNILFFVSLLYIQPFTIVD
jgi:hypothetical protein